MWDQRQVVKQFLKITVSSSLLLTAIPPTGPVKPGSISSAAFPLPSADSISCSLWAGSQSFTRISQSLTRVTSLQHNQSRCSLIILLHFHLCLLSPAAAATCPRSRTSSPKPCVFSPCYLMLPPQTISRIPEHAWALAYKGASGLMLLCGCPSSPCRTADSQ